MEDYQSSLFNGSPCIENPFALSPSNASAKSPLVPNMAESDHFSEELLDFLHEVTLEASPSSELSAAPYTRPCLVIDNNGAMNMPSTTVAGADRICTKIGRGFNRHGKEIKDGQQFMRKSSKRQRAAVVGESGRGDHILRERQRRDDMSDKFIKLEKLLPWRTKRDRTAVVDDAIEFVREMQNTLKRLEKKMQDRDCTLAPMDLIEIDHNSVHSMQNPSSNIQFKSCNQPAQITSPDIHVQSNTSTGEITIEITCSLRPRFMTNLMIAMEELHLDVCQCNYSKKMPDILCILVAKQRPLSLQQSLKEIVTVLKCTLS